MSDRELVADLHVHTTASDGELTIDEIPAAAASAGLDCVAVTDHDRLHSRLDAPVTSRDGVTLVHGIELRVDAGTERVDLLGYAVERTGGLAAEIERLQRNRAERGGRIVECVEDRLGVTLDVEPRAGLGRPHIARAVDESDADCGYQEAFDSLIGDDCPCYVARDVPSFERGVALLSDACSVVSLAHPFRYADPESALELAEHLDAVERHYPYESAVDAAAIDRVVDQYDLLVTGGSDAHGRTLGLAGLTATEFADVARHLPQAQT